jgi:hypothetical protein
MVWFFLHDILKFGTSITELPHLYKHNAYVVFDLQPATRKICSKVYDITLRDLYTLNTMYTYYRPH